jgi:mono/diheme cytochrome c family protein
MSSFTTSRALFLLLLSALGVRAAGFTADSVRGERLFQTLACVQCHSVNGVGGSAAPDLGRMVDRSLTPAALAATMWNHAPGMWAAMREHQVTGSQLDAQAARDLMAFFYAARFFEKPGDAGRGKRAFESRGCAKCHGLSGAVNPKAKPVTQWQGLADPLALVEEMWNHRADMLAEAGAKGAPAPQLSVQDLTDILVYLRNLPDNRSKSGVFRIDVGGADQPVFQTAGCAKCHKTVEALANRLQGQTLTEIAVEMWNHTPLMAAEGAPVTPLAPGEMKALVSSLWASKFFGKAGRPGPGAGIFAKNCGVCHNDSSSGAPPLPVAGREFSAAAMVSALWRHGPDMYAGMKAKGLAWPGFEGAQMADLIAYLNSKGPAQP